MYPEGNSPGNTHGSLGARLIRIVSPIQRLAELNGDSRAGALNDRDSIVSFLRREYDSGPWEGTQVFLILADAIERHVDRDCHE